MLTAQQLLLCADIESDQKGRCTPTFYLESIIASLERWIDELAERAIKIVRSLMDSGI